MKLKTFRILTKDIDENEEITEFLLEELEQELIKPNWAKGKCLWDSFNSTMSFFDFWAENFHSNNYNDSIDCWEDPFSKKRYSRIMGGKVIVTLNCQYEFVLTDPDFEFEQLKTISEV